ncbi:MAG: IS110 family transposase [Candidatus Taylorbacteria bacterium]|nr:IS110 family transposase [Candidatus Taylorbacteria bacterium]
MYTLGIDLHKKSSVWVLIDEQRTEVWKQNVPCHPNNVSIAVEKIPVSPKEIQVAIEPVAGWRWVSQQLEDVGMKVHIAHPRKIQLIAKSTKKNDDEDSRTLANLLHSGFFPEAHRTKEEIYQLRLLLRERTFIVRQRTSVKNQLHGIATTQGLHLIAGGNPLFKKGKAGIMMGENFVLKELHLLEEDLGKRIKPFDDKLHREIKNFPEANILQTMPGVGGITALTIIAEVDDFKRFKTGRKLTSFAGLVPRQRSSGETVRYGSITHNGSAPLRTVLVETAMRIREGNAPELFAFVKRLTPICGAKKARVALARKLLVIMWKMVTTNTPYNPKFPFSSCTTKVSDLDTGTGV